MIIRVSIEFKKASEQTRTAEIKKFLRQKGCLEKDPAALQEYRKT